MISEKKNGGENDRKMQRSARTHYGIELNTAEKNGRRNDRVLQESGRSVRIHKGGGIITPEKDDGRND